MNYIAIISILRHQIDKLYGALLPFLVDGSGVARNIVSLITMSVFILLIRKYNRWIWIKNANKRV
jgi:hypothetical protein